MSARPSAPGHQVHAGPAEGRFSHSFALAGLLLQCHTLDRIFCELRGFCIWKGDINSVDQVDLAIMDWEQILSFLSPDSLLSQTPLTKLDLEQMWYSIYLRWPSAKYHKVTCYNKAEFSSKKVRLPFVQSTQVELCDITGGWKPRVPCHHPTHTTLASTAIIWKGDKVAPVLCPLCNVHLVQLLLGRAPAPAAELNHSAVTLIWLTPLFIALEKGSAKSPARNAVKQTWAQS